MKARLLVAVLSCGTPPAPPEPPAPPPPGFSGDAAMATMDALMALPRGLGVPDRDASIDTLADLLREAGAATSVTVPFVARDRDGTEYRLANVIAEFRPDAEHRFALATHFDTRPWADEDPDPNAHHLPVPGANDGTSGVAVILRLAPLLLRDLPPTVGFTVVLFDGEELGRASDMDAYCAGSRRLAEDIEAPVFAHLRRASFGIVLDMVGDRDLRLRPEPNSTRAAPDLVDHVWSTARALGYAQFDPDERELGILDDHKFMTAAGIPSILLIDRDYPPWHTRFDTLDKVGPASLEAVGETLRTALVAYPFDADG